MAYKDKKREKQVKRIWYENHREEHITRSKQRRLETAKWLRDYKCKSVCVDCGMYFNLQPECCDFHHITGDKGRNIAEINTINLLKKELKKCIPLCANCHRTRHARSSMDSEQ